MLWNKPEFIENRIGTSLKKTHIHVPLSRKYIQILWNCMTLPFIHYLTDIVCHVTFLVVGMSPYDDILQYIYDYEPSDVLMWFTKKMNDSIDVHVDFVVKLGGSAMTNKSENETINKSNIQSAANVLLQSWKNGKKFIIVHGAG